MEFYRRVGNQGSLELRRNGAIRRATCMIVREMDRGETYGSRGCGIQVDDARFIEISTN
ncbi:uncharacterized protein LOC116414162 isoform X2 [Apis florea]|uniref:uncharacterized protein LOC116414162 isoform X2 n=1 Tax=Apis florea TaxID=7463 RepID=UPI0012FEA5B0|nr:uncharacterized protein LOC116414162 isoform X2 [Apis florea]